MILGWLFFVGVLNGFIIFFIDKFYKRKIKKIENDHSLHIKLLQKRYQNYLELFIHRFKKYRK